MKLLQALRSTRQRKKGPLLRITTHIYRPVFRVLRAKKRTDYSNNKDLELRQVQKSQKILKRMQL